MKIGILKELQPSENRVAASPETVVRLSKQGFEVLVETQAGERANFTDDAYKAVNAQIASSADEVFENSDIILKVQPFSADEVEKLKKIRLRSAIWSLRRIKNFSKS